MTRRTKANVAALSFVAIAVTSVVSIAVTQQEIARGILGVDPVTQDMNVNQDSGIDVADAVAASQPQPPTACLLYTSPSPRD